MATDIYSSFRFVGSEKGTDKLSHDGYAYNLCRYFEAKLYRTAKFEWGKECTTLPD